jgi:hypothetical protein
MCKVTAPAGAPLTQVLAAAKASSNPANCVTSFSLAGGRIASLNGAAPANQDEAWLLRLDRGAEVPAAEQPVGFGDVISLRLGEPRSSLATAAGPQGAAGGAGAPGPRGRRGAKGRPGHNAHITCRAHGRKRSGKARVRCNVRKGKRRG